MEEQASRVSTKTRENFLNHQNCPELPEEVFTAAKMRVTDIQIVKKDKG